MNIANKIDHTMLKPDATSDVIRQYCEDALRYRFASVCVNSCHVPAVAAMLKDSGVKVCCVVGFPLGAMLTQAKAFETSQAVELGAEEIDMVINIGAAKDGNWDLVLADIRAVAEAASPAPVKVILETCLLTDDEKVQACRMVEKAGAAFVKTSTGFSDGGATAADIRLMKETVGDRLQIKASGGIRTPEAAKELLEAGADRIGAGNGVVLLSQ